MKRVFLLLVVVLALGAGAWWFFGRSKAGAATFRTAEVRRGDLVSTISATGTVEPEELIDIGAQVAGRIIKFGVDTNGKPVDYGSHVEEGMLLAEIDKSIYDAEKRQALAGLADAEAGVKRAEADLAQMKARLYQAERDWKRAETLGPSDALAQVTYDQYRSAYEVAQANIAVGEASILQAKAAVDQAQGNLERAERNLSYTTINSPVNGVIIDRRVNIGQTVVASLNAPSLFLIATDLRRMQVWVAVNEADVGKIKPDQPVTFTVDAFPGEAFTGHVNKVRLNAAMTQNVVTYTVEVTTDNSDGRLLPYLTANLHFEVDRHDDVLMVPNAALRYTPRPEQMAPEARAAFEAQANGGGGPGDPRGRGGSASAPSAGAPSTGAPSTGAPSTGAPSTGTVVAAMSGPGAGGGGGGGPGGREGGRRRGRGEGGPSNRKAPGAEELRPETVWVRDGAFLRPLNVVAAATDGTETEVRGPDLKDGLEVVVGEVAPDRGATASSGGTNPFAPQPMRRGPRGGGGGGGGGGGRSGR